MFKIEFIDWAAFKSFLEVDSQGTVKGDMRSSSQMIQTEMDPSVCYGEITIGSFNERFESPLYYWNQKQYEEQWHSAMSRFLAGANKTALITAMYDPMTANFLTWWPFYRKDQIVFVQNHLLFLDKLVKPFDIRDIDEFVPPHKSVDEDGNRISEWSIPFTDIQEFIRTL